ncbi:MAG: hypothetical protein ACRD0G_16360 [Acidimicrobiales bacterium]
MPEPPTTSPKPESDPDADDGAFEPDVVDVEPGVPPAPLMGDGDPT